MRGKGGGIGMVVLLVVLAVVLLLAAKAWKSATPTLSQLPGGENLGPVSDHGHSEALEALPGNSLPNLEQMQKATSEYSDLVQETLEESD
jgi:hypothetical protein